jgi:hypothetical protein
MHYSLGVPMSIDVYGFLGSDIRDVESRVLQSFTTLGFSVAIHPEMTLHESTPCGCLYLTFTETPPQIGRVRPGVPLLLGFGFGVSKRTARSAGWPPKGVKGYSYEVCTRTSSGRSNADYFAQALTVAILAKETNGYFYINGDDVAVPGKLGLDQILEELNGTAGDEFDSGAHPFEAWPPIVPNVPFAWPEPIAAVQDHHTKVVSDYPKKRFKISVIEGVGWALVLYFVIAIVIYS